MNRQDLVQYRDETAYINRQLEDVNIRRERLTKITPSYTEKYSSSANDKIGDGVAELVDREEKIFEKIQTRLLEREEIKQAVDTMKEPYRTILYYVYISEKPMRLAEMCRRGIISYEYKYLQKLHGKALDKFDAKYNE